MTEKFNQYIEKIEESKSITLMQKAAQLQAEGKEIINLTGGEPDFDTPALIVEEAAQALRNGDTHYLVHRILNNRHIKPMQLHPY